MRKVKKEEFIEFLKSYPDEFYSDYTAIGDPPVTNYHDYIGHGIIARKVHDWMGPNGEIDHDNTCQYYEYFIDG